MSTKSLLISFVTLTLGADYIPECNYAAIPPFYYPIDACESDINATASIISSFKYICNENDTVEQYIYDTFNCEGTPTSMITNMTYLDIQHYSCNQPSSCDYAIQCSFLECNSNSSDTECNLCSAESYQDLLTQNHDTHCRPYIKDQCLGSNESFAYSFQCQGGVLSEYYKFSCDDTGFVLDSFGADDSTCKDEDADDKYAYYTVDCNPNQVAPECNYAEANFHFYPIGACETDVNATSGEIISFKYLCNDNEIEMNIYHTYDCYGEPNATITNQTELASLGLEDWQCRSNNGDCSYAVGCSFSDCGGSGCESCSGSDIQTLAETQDTHCLPYITNECFGVPDFKHQSVCSNGGKYSELTESFYFGSECNDDNYGYGDVFGGRSDTCRDDNGDDIYNYYQIDCEPEVIQPECNYAATGFHFYAINACDSYNTVMNGTSYKSSFKYVCTDDGDIEKYSYSTLNCEGEADDVSIADVEHHQCKAARDCNYATVCSYDDCSANVNDTTCSICSEANYIDNYGEDHSSHCFPYITDGCYGLKDELIYSTTCMNNEFTEGFYYGRECTDDTYQFGFGYGGINSTCQYGTYYEVECVIAPTSYPTEQPTSFITEGNETTIVPEDSTDKANNLYCIYLCKCNFIYYIINKHLN